jgi:fused signal recognition particle receptor
MAFGKEKKGNIFGRLSRKISDAIMMRPTVDEEFLEELEEILITSDIGMDTALHITSELREKIRDEYLETPEQVKLGIIEIVRGIVDKGERIKLASEYPLVILMIGVNGGGKTTSVAKLAHMYNNMGKKVLLAAADTFRAAAADQLQIWAERTGTDIVRHAEGADPSAVIYDSIQASKARGIDVLICDTAGRLHNKKNLMNELEKMNKIISREWPEASRENLLVLDATTGKNAVSQAEEFGSVSDITGIVITKLDGTAKGGIAITISDEYDLPVKLLGIGERMIDLTEFDPAEFAASIFEEDEEDI